ncbi:MAG: hypothetical protein PF795_03825, partial [Kiritimatiellae bacterium]|nr:hypothetical protein [Kiritimatiellia bacterium]
MTQSTSFHILFTHLLLLFAVTPLHGKVYHFADHGPTDFFAFVFDSGRSWDWDGNEFRLDTTGGESNLRNSGAVVYISEAERALQPDFVVSSTLAYQTDGTPSEFTRLGVVALSDEAQAGGTDPGTSTTRGYWATFMPLMPESGRDGVGSELQILKNGEGVLSAAWPHAPVGPGGELRLSLAGSYTPSGDLDLSFTVEANGDSVTTPVFHDSDPLTGGWFGLQHRNQPRVSRIGHRAFAIADIPHPPRTPPENDNEVFVHPGIFNSQSELDRIHALYQSGTPHPILTGLNELITHPLADLSRAHQALETVWIKKAAGTPEEKRIREDAAALGHVAQPQARRCGGSAVMSCPASTMRPWCRRVTP